MIFVVMLYSSVYYIFMCKGFFQCKTNMRETNSKILSVVLSLLFLKELVGFSHMHLDSRVDTDENAYSHFKEVFSNDLPQSGINKQMYSNQFEDKSMHLKC